MVTLKEVALEAGVSTSAVSRTFTKGSSVAPKTRKKVEAAVKKLGYSPNFLARGLSTRRTKLIGLVSNNFHNPFFLEIFDLFTRGLQELDLRPLLVNLSEENDPESSVNMLKQYSVDGVIVASSTLSPDFARTFRDAGVPVVHSFGRQTSSPRVHVVSIDNVEAGRIAAKTLIERGYRSVGMMAGPRTASTTEDRLKGFTEIMAENPQIDHSVSFAHAYSFEAGRSEMLKLIRQNRKEAYFCGDDVLSIGALSAAAEQGLNVPNDLGIIGVNDMKMANWQNFNLTTIRQPVQEIVQSSIELVGTMLEDPDRLPEARLFPCEVVERGTLRPPRPR